jgi:hypothetical protein
VRTRHISKIIYFMAAVFQLQERSRFFLRPFRRPEKGFIFCCTPPLRWGGKSLGF